MNHHPSADEQFISKINSLLDENLSDENFGVTELCNKMGLSRSQLHRKLKRITGKSTSATIRIFRLSKAHELLKNDTATASEIAYQVGFSSPSYFHTSFKNQYGYTPGEAKFHEEPREVEPEKSRSLFWVGLSIILFGLLAYFGYEELSSDVQYSKEVPTEKVKSIAVLAFQDLSEDQDQKFLGMSLAAEIINILDDVEGLQVIGQTSAFSLMDKNLTLDSIAKLLNVNFILEGTILENDGSIDVIAVLSNGETGQTMISPKYSIVSGEVLTAREKIAKQVAFELKMKVNEDVLASSSESNSQVKVLEQEIYYQMSKRASEEIIRELCESCLQLDSTYLPCLAWRGVYPESIEDQKQIIDRMMSIDSVSEYTQFVKGNYFIHTELDFQNAIKSYKKMLAAEPSDNRMLSEAAFYIGHFDVDLGMKYLKIAMARDPLYFGNFNGLFYMNFFKGDFLKAVDYIEEMETLTNRKKSWEKIYMYIAGGYHKEAEVAIEEFIDSGPEGWSAKGLESFKMLSELFNDAGRIDNQEFYERYRQLKTFRELAGISDFHPYIYASLVALHGNDDLAFHLLEKAYVEKKSFYFKELKYSPWFKDLHDDKRWPVFLKKLRVPGY